MDDTYAIFVYRTYEFFRIIYEMVNDQQITISRCFGNSTKHFYYYDL